MEIGMLPSHIELETRLAESSVGTRRREAIQRHQWGVWALSGPNEDLTRPAFPQWRTVVQMAFAITVTMVTLFIVFASIVAITRA